jgi:structural maintenance of chromosome 3 (chondroitin sulfate proteoglycan 6)
LYNQAVKDLDEDVRNGYHGMLVDLFQCEPHLYKAVEQTAGNKLFYHVVKNRYVATKIIQELNRWNRFGFSYG